ncbi:MAG TPA: carboxypeptidase M32, partial [Rhodothermales bacterium]|nr:carboxypeptidase M32 [Rhodothermales bacterium]
YFPESLSGITLQDFYRAINRVTPSLIRVEADEVTYPLHVLLRFELEADLIEGLLEVRDLPEIWRTKMQSYLGVTPKNETEGVLQDIHWSLGAFGYFPTYTLGTLYAAQFYEQASASLGDLDNQIKAGNFAPLREWLRTQIHQFGRSKSASMLVNQITGSGLTTAPWIQYIKKKYGEIYEL